MPPAQVGVLIPLNKSFEVDDSLLKLEVLEGVNVVGRSNVPVTDKRLSRKHLTLSTSADGLADLLVEGMNPVVINSGGQRKIVSSGEMAAIMSGDVIELIPGSYCFKYVALNDERKFPMARNNSEGDSVLKNAGGGTKRAREANGGASPGCSMALHKSERKEREESSCIRNNQNAEYKTEDASASGKNEEALGRFHVSDDKLPLTFRLMKVRGLPHWANTSCVSMEDVIKGDVLVAILSNYMIDMEWLLSACPTLKRVPQVLVVHGESDGSLEFMKKTKPSNWILHKPPLPISYGTHHSKVMFLVYPRGIRVVVHTANLIHVDWNNKSQGLWMQDFPWKGENGASKGTEFERDLVDYLQALKLPEFIADLQAHGRFRIDASFFKNFDYGNAAVRLIASVPGYHSGPHLKKWGHMKLRSVLEGHTFDEEFKNSPLVYQFSSLGSLDGKWMNELRSSMSSGISADKIPLGLGEPLVIWPTVEDVRWSLEGYAAGSCIPSPMKNVEKEFLKKYWARWKATYTGRCRAMPHIKTFARYNGQNLAWFLLTSANLSKAAWGALQKNNSQLMIRSYELGVLFLPNALKNSCGFSCTEDKTRAVDGPVRKTKLVSLAWSGRTNPDSDYDIIPLPIPYELPPQLYSTQDVPWSWDRIYRQKDAYGQVWPRS